jgi:hypothetical protein
MARYYEITVTPQGGTPLVFTSFPNGQNDPGALNVELDLLTSYYGVPASGGSSGDAGNSTISIEGISLELLQQGTVFGLQPSNKPGAKITVYGGMKPGLPLATANASYAGLLLQGQIYQSWANWVGTEMNLNFVVVPSGFTLSNAGPFLFNWQAGQSLGQAITNTLTVAYPQYAVILHIASTYATNHPIVHWCKSLTQFGNLVYSLTKAVKITTYNGNTILVYDGTVVTTSKQLVFTDLIGQPKWVNPNIMQFMTVMRADVQVGSYVLMPQGVQDAPGIVTQTGSALPSSLKYQSTFQGTFIIESVRHIGNFRDPNGASWASIFQAVPQGANNAG